VPFGVSIRINFRDNAWLPRKITPDGYYADVPLTAVKLIDIPNSGQRPTENPA
jgi:hypothetical protein